MLKPEESEAVGGYLKTLQIIVGALVFGLVMFLGIVLLLHFQQGPFQRPQAGVESLPVISVVAFVIAAIQVPLAFVIPGVVAESQCKKIADGTWNPMENSNAPPLDPKMMTDVTKLLFVNQTRTIIGAALLEGAGFLALIAYMIEGERYVLGLALFLIGGVASRFPTRTGLENWIDDRLGRIEELRHRMI